MSVYVLLAMIYTVTGSGLSPNATWSAEFNSLAACHDAGEALAKKFAGQKNTMAPGAWGIDYVCVEK